VEIDAEFRCERLVWEVKVNGDGDAENRMSFEGVTAARTEGQHVYRAHHSWAQSGAVSGWQAVPELTSPHVAVKNTRIDRTTVQTIVEFRQAPSAEQPASACVRSLDFGVFSMNCEEFRRKENARDDDTDFIQKSIRWEVPGQLVLHVQLPEDMLLMGRPFAEVYQLFQTADEEVEVFDATLSAGATRLLHYSDLTRVASLHIYRPPKWVAYRICWRLGHPPRDGNPPGAAELARFEGRRSQLLSIRRLFANANADLNPSDLEAKQNVISKLAEFSAFFVRTIADQFAPAADGGDDGLPINIANLEISLMAVYLAGDPEREVLTIVAGTNVFDSKLWDFSLSLGDGIAGRAAKRLQPRVYDDAQAAGTPWGDVYVPLSGTRHAWLMSVPIWKETLRRPYAVLNVGTFDRGQAATLRTCENEKVVAAVLEYANKDFIRGLLNAICPPGLRGSKT
jgi:hypothetical protein